MVPHRAIPMLGVLLTFHYKGTGQFEVQQNRFTLEFLKHFQVVQGSLDANSMLQHLQQSIEDLCREALNLPAPVPVQVLNIMRT